MEKLVILNLVRDLKKNGFAVVVQIKSHQQQLYSAQGNLPPCPELKHKYDEWQSALYNICSSDNQEKKVTKNSEIPLKAKVQQALSQTLSQKYQEATESLIQHLNEWLSSEGFMPIKEILEKEVSNSEQARIIIYCAEYLIKQLPWEHWDWKLNHQSSTIVWGYSSYKLQSPIIKNKLKILIIASKFEDIEIDEIKLLMENIPHVDVLPPLINESREKVIDALRDSCCDVLYFAGHSTASDNIGKFYINTCESLEISDIRNALEKAIKNGLKLAIFNSCISLSIAQQLEEENLQLLNLIVMRDIIQDKASYIFLKELLKAFLKEKQPLHIAADVARKSLESLEGEYPGSILQPLLISATEEPQYLENWIKEPTYFRFIYRLLTASFLITILIIGLRLSGIFELLELKAYDHLMQQRQVETIDHRIVVVEITKDDFPKGSYLAFEDKTIAQAINKLEQYEARVIGIDIHRYAPRGSGRQDLIKQLKSNDNIFVVCAFDNDNIDYAPPPELTSKEFQERLGFSNLISDDVDSKIRRQLLSYNPGLSASISPCHTPYSLSFQLAYRYLAQEGKTLEVSPQTQDWYFNEVILKKLPSVYGGYNSLDGQSSQVMINYRSRNTPGQKISLQQLLYEPIDATLIKDKIALIGYTADVVRDNFDTPMGNLPGVWIHAHMTSQVISAIMDKRPLIWVLPQWNSLQWGDTLYVFIWSFLGGFLALWWRFQSLWIHWRRYAGMFLCIAIAFWLFHQISLLMLQQGLWLPFTPSLLCLFLTSLTISFYIYKVNKYIKF